MKKFTKTKAIKIFLFAFLLFAAGTTNAQIGIGIANPAASAQLDVNSTTKGFLPPRMTKQQRDAIATPEAGLSIWCKDCGILGEIQIYNGFKWTNSYGGYTTEMVPEVLIGSQVWMTRNLDVVTYRNGDTIPQVSDPTEWASLTTGAWCYNKNDSAFGAVFGKLYNWYAVNDPRGLAPAGYHIPSVTEWASLVDYLGGPAVASVKLKATPLWIYYNASNASAAATNESGFSGLPGGFRSWYNGDFSGHDGSLFGIFAYWWTTTEVTTPIPGTNYAWSYTLVAGRSTSPNGDINPIEEEKRMGLSVRCIRGF